MLKGYNLLMEWLQILMYLKFLIFCHSAKDTLKKLSTLISSQKNLILKVELIKENRFYSINWALQWCQWQIFSLHCELENGQFIWLVNNRCSYLHFRMPGLRKQIDKEYFSLSMLTITWNTTRERTKNDVFYHFNHSKNKEILWWRDYLLEIPEQWLKS